MNKYLKSLFVFLVFNFIEDDINPVSVGGGGIECPPLAKSAPVLQVLHFE